jgi:hypothetical protein
MPLTLEKHKKKGKIDILLNELKKKKKKKLHAAVFLNEPLHFFIIISHLFSLFPKFSLATSFFFQNFLLLFLSSYLFFCQKIEK